MTPVQTNQRAPNLVQRNPQNPRNEESKETLESSKKRLTKQERIAAYKQKEAAQLALNAQIKQASNRDKILRRIEAGDEIFLKREVQEIKETIPSLYVRKEKFELHNELEQLKSLLEVVRTRHWNKACQYALLEKLACVNELVSIHHWDDAIKNVAKSLRNVIFKQPESIQELTNLPENFLEMIAVWIKFLETEEIGYFINGQAVLNKLASPILKSFYDLGQTTSQPIDVKKNSVIIRQMLTFVSECEVNSPNSDVISLQAVNFCWGVMDSKLKELLHVTYRNRPAQKVLREFQHLLPYVEELREKGILARHPTERIKLEQSQKLLSPLGENSRNNSQLMLFPAPNYSDGDDKPNVTFKIEYTQ